jgi:hypothetical protein
VAHRACAADLARACAGVAAFIANVGSTSSIEPSNRNCASLS